MEDNKIIMSEHKIDYEYKQIYVNFAADAPMLRELIKIKYPELSGFEVTTKRGHANV